MNKRQRKKQISVGWRKAVKQYTRAGNNNIIIRKKFCTRHGWAPHNCGRCLRCHPQEELTQSAAILSYLRGWKRPKGMSSKMAIAKWSWFISRSS